ncbi:cytochrome c biogenesis CcdA family protein [Leucobacter sp. M11]|uniref:cytochrome c biogenesis CcdA family protein n=1 Tax=Leucobacter sp. M11 TaxID=2993565 RepID=UPI002D7FA91D|nr:cytochrome c biogenesis protein CcdA [Leucobacter sp. M11]MEB4614670.1 cytochrome c biogenesis protein CcdA [Leucobacter sp. M11]
MGIGEIITDGQLLIAVLLSLAAGLVSFASPCVLPLVPGYLAYVGGVATADDGGKGTRGRLLAGVGLFIAGFSAIFVAITGLGASVGVWFLEWENVLTRVMGALVILMGLVFMGQMRFMQTTKKMRFKPKVGLMGAPVLGAVFAIGWTPCMGPTLTMIMALSMQSGSVGRGVILGLFYCLGLGIPFLLVALGFGWVAQTTTFLRRHIRVINLIGGGLLIVIGLLMVSGIWSKMMFALQAVIGGYVTPI